MDFQAYDPQGIEGTLVDYSLNRDGPFSTHLRYYTDPSAAVITAVTSIGNQSVLVTWNAPAEPNEIITGYTLTYNVGGLLKVSVNVSFTGEIVCTNKCFTYT